MSRPPEITLPFRPIRQPPARQRAVVRGDSCRDFFARGVDGYGVRGSFGVFVLFDHLWEGQGCCSHGEERRAQVPGGVADEESGFSGCEVAGGDD
jgi:hypothetical protein